MCCVISLPCLSCSAGASDSQDVTPQHCFLHCLFSHTALEQGTNKEPDYDLTVLPSNLVCHRFYNYHSQLWWAVTLMLAPNLTLDTHHLLTDCLRTPRYRCSGSVKLTVKCFLSYHSHFDELWGSCHLLQPMRSLVPGYFLFFFYRIHKLNFPLIVLRIQVFIYGNVYNCSSIVFAHFGYFISQ